MGWLSRDKYGVKEHPPLHIIPILRWIEVLMLIAAYHKTLKMGRTISDLGGCEQLQSKHIAETIRYRSLDRQWYG